jgi:hypothetical protein
MQLSNWRKRQYLHNLSPVPLIRALAKELMANKATARNHFIFYLQNKTIIASLFFRDSDCS